MFLPYGAGMSQQLSARFLHEWQILAEPEVPALPILHAQVCRERKGVGRTLRCLFIDELQSVNDIEPPPAVESASPHSTTLGNMDRTSNQSRISPHVMIGSSVPSPHSPHESRRGS